VLVPKWLAYLARRNSHIHQQELDISEEFPLWQLFQHFDIILQNPTMEYFDILPYTIYVYM
jgi:hypothetical protein